MGYEKATCAICKKNLRKEYPYQKYHQPKCSRSARRLRDKKYKLAKKYPIIN